LYPEIEEPYKLLYSDNKKWDAEMNSA
jgi:hypothetical protein